MIDYGRFALSLIRTYPQSVTTVVVCSLAMFALIALYLGPESFEALCRFLQWPVVLATFLVLNSACRHPVGSDPYVFCLLRGLHHD